VEFLGRREDVRDILQGFDVLWVPSRQEPFGIVLIEAAFSGVPVVANPVGGIPEIVVAGSTGFLVKNTAETVAALKSLADASAWERFSRAARSRAERMFDMKPLGRKLVEVYEEILK
jgi:glycosyltransferase involved in cell wall biosynthesis